jgi:hypothetical protein
VKFFRMIRIVTFLAVSLVAIAGWAASSGGSYHLAKTYKFGAAAGGKEYFDYIMVDSDARRVYVTHGTEVLVVNADTGALVGKISGLQRNHGVVLVKDAGRGFISDGDAGEVVIFDPSTLQTISKVKAADDADCIIYDPASGNVFTFNGDSGNATAIDPKTGKLVGIVALGGKPEYAAADGKGTLFANLEDKNQVVVVDSRALKVKTHYPVAPGGSPVSMAMDREHRRLFIGARNPQLLLVMNADNGKVVQSMPISAGVDAIVFDPGTAQVFVSTREGKIHIFHEDSADHVSAVETVNTQVGAKTMGVDSKTHKLFTDTADFGSAPPPTPKRPHPTPAPIPGTLRLLVYSQ